MSNNPFPGLRSFKQDEAPLFFGRDGQSEQLLKRLQKSRFLALVGVSGSGKSSLIRAGLIPKLDGGLMSSVDSDWRVAVFRPGDNPIGNMARALVTEAGLGGDSDFEDVEVAIAETTLRRGNLGLLELLKEAKRKVRENGEPFLGPNENVLVVVDQFEEIFRIIEQYDELVRVKQLGGDNSDVAATAAADGLKYHPREEASAFVKLLLESTRKNKHKEYHENVYVIVTMRSDYLGDTAQFGGMPERINDGQYLIPRMDRADRRKAIVGPIAVEGGSITEPLINQLLNDAGEDPRRLPILQHALMRMWELAERAPQNGGLNLDHYEQIEKLSGALSQHANEAFRDLSPKHQDLAAKIFKSLTEKGLANREIRRPMKIADICAVVEAEEEDVKTVVDCFRKNGRWFLMPSVDEKRDLTSDTLIDISHESLISGWDRLRGWVNEEAESARTYKRLADTAILKELGKEDFYRGPALQLAQKWQTDNAPNPAWARRYHPEFDKAIAFLDGSVKDTQQREQAERDRIATDRRRTRNYNIGLLILAIVSAGIAVYAYSTKQSAVAAQQAVVEAQKEVVKAQEFALATEKDRVINESKLKDAAIAEQTRAQAAEKKALDSLEKEQKAVQEANDAKAVAIAQRDRATRLQQENLDQATNYGYFKTAFDNVAEREYDKAVSSLRRALAYFKEKEDKARTDSERQENKNNRITTHINIADVYRSDEKKEALAVREYDRAIDLLKSGDNQTLAQTLMKAGSVWKDSKDDEEGNATDAAKYYEDAAEVYKDRLHQSDKASSAWLEAGKIHARFDKEESVRKAAQDFNKAISAQGKDNKKIAATNAKIGEAYLQIADKSDDSEDAEDEPFSLPEDPVPTDDPNAQDRVRATGARYFRNAANAYFDDDKEAAAKMRRRAGKILGGSVFQRDLAAAAEEFTAAAKIYSQLSDVGEQKEVFLEAGNTLLDSDSAFGRRLADQFYQSAVDLYVSNNEEKAGVLNQIAEAFTSSSEVTHKHKAADYYQQASVIYREMNRKSDEADALVSAGNALSDLNDDVSVAKTKEIYDKAIAVYQNDSAEQAKTLNKIANSYSESEEPAKRELAIPFYRREASLARQAGNKSQEANALLDAGEVLIGIKREGAEEEATKAFQEAIDVYQNDVPFQTNLIGRIATLYATEDPPKKERALQEYQRAIVFAREHNDKGAEVSAILAKARGVGRLGGPEVQSQINELYDQAIAVFNDNPAKKVSTIIRVGRVIIGPGRDAGRVEKAEQYFTTALNLAEAQPDKKIAGYAHLNLGAAIPLGAGTRKKIQHYESALAIFEGEGDQFGQAMTLYRLITVKRAQAKDLATRSLALFSRVLPGLESSLSKEELGEAYYAIGSMMHREKKDYKAAIDYYNRAIEIFKTVPDLTSRISVTNTQIRAVQKIIDNPPN